MKLKSFFLSLVLAVALLGMNGCKEDVNLSKIDGEDVFLELGVAAPIAHSTAYARKLYEINDNGYYVYQNADGVMTIALRARKRIPFTGFLASLPPIEPNAYDPSQINVNDLATLQLADSVKLKDVFGREIGKNSHLPVLNSFFRVYFATKSNMSFDMTFHDIYGINKDFNNGAEARIATNIVGTEVIRHTSLPRYINYRSGRDSADYIQHYLDSLTVTDERANFSQMFNRPLGELPQYLEYKFQVKPTAVPQNLDDTMFVDAWFHMPVDTKGRDDGDPYGFILNYTDTLDVDSEDFYDEEIDSLLAKHADYITIYIDGKNSTPFNVEATATYLDANKMPIRYKDNTRREDKFSMQGAPINGDGRVIESLVRNFETQTIVFGDPKDIDKSLYQGSSNYASRLDTKLDQDRDLLRKMKYIVVNVKGTGTTAGDPVQLHFTDFIYLKLSAKVHAHATKTDLENL